MYEDAYDYLKDTMPFGSAEESGASPHSPEMANTPFDDAAIAARDDVVSSRAQFEMLPGHIKAMLLEDGYVE